MNIYTHVNREAEVAAINALPNVPKSITDQSKPDDEDEEGLAGAVVPC